MEENRIMIKKSWIIIALMVMLVFCMGSACAADDVDDAVAVDEDMESVDASIDEVDNSDMQSYQDEKSLSTEGTSVNVYYWSQLKTNCEKPTDMTINLKGSSYTVGEQIDFNNSATIIGSTSTYITGGNGITPFLNSNSSLSITFLNVRFKNMNVENLMRLAGNNTFENCTFTNIVASSNTNNVLWNDGDSMEITGCNFTNCTTGRGVISNYDSSGSTTAQMIVNNSNFNGNSARSYAGAINNRGILNVCNSNFTDNSASTWAGAINGVANTETYINDSLFRNNVAGWNGGALYTYSLLEVHNSIFEGNNCTTNNGGGAIGAYNFISTYNITIDSCNFTNNINLCKAFDNLSTTSLGRGGAVSVLNGGYLDVHNSRFVNNFARIGQAIAAATYNYANATGGVPHISIYNNQFINHTGDNDTVYITGNDIVFTNNTFENSVQTIEYTGNSNSITNDLFKISNEILGASQKGILSEEEMKFDIIYIDCNSELDSYYLSYLWYEENQHWSFDGWENAIGASEDDLYGSIDLLNENGIIYIANGDYKLEQFGNSWHTGFSKNRSIIGQENTIFNFGINSDLSDGTFTFINITFNGYSCTFSSNIKFINCTFINAPLFISSKVDGLSNDELKPHAYTHTIDFENCTFKDYTGDNFINMYKCFQINFNGCDFSNMVVDSFVYRHSFDNYVYDEENWNWVLIEDQSGVCYFDEDALSLTNCSFLGCTYNGIVDSAADFADVVEITDCKYDSEVTPGVTVVDNHNYINSTELIPSSLTVSVADVSYGGNFTINVKLDVPVDDVVYVTINGKEYEVDVENGTGSLVVSDKLAAGSYNVSAVYEGDDMYDESNADSNFTVSPLTAKLSASDVKMTYNAAVKSMTVKASNIADGSVISVKINGKTLNGIVKDGKAVIKMPAKLAAKKYAAAITYAGNDNVTSASAKANVIVLKAKPKMTAKKATFKAKKKTKKYSIVLKDNKKKALKKVKVTLKVKGKTYKAKTNAKGKATFKITKLTKKGTYKAKVKFAGNANFKAVSKTVKIKVKK